MITDVAVVVPAADEQDEIGGCLRSIAAAAHALACRSRAVRVHTVVVLDACTDGTAGVLAGFPRVHQVPSSARCVGAARRVGAEYVLRRFPDDSVLLASTDADCRVPGDWLAHLLALADRDAQLVLGTVRPREGLPAEVADAWHRSHELGDGHAHVHGANLALTGSAYATVGGWHDLPLHEDVDLVQRAVAAQLRIVRTGGAPVLTSSRLDGRTPAGFAAHLRQLHDHAS